MPARASRRVEAAAFEDLNIAIPPGFRLASGDALNDAHVPLRRFGRADRPHVVALGGISAGRDVCGEAGWWRETIVEHGAIDLDRFCVLGLDFAPLSDQRARLSPHDQARLLALALDGLGVARLHGFVGASYGGLVGLGFAAYAPERLGRLCVISAAHRQSSQSLALRGVQRRVVEFGLAHGDGAGGLALARQLAMITYRTGEEFEARFGAGVGADGRGEVDRYLESRGAAYARKALQQRWLTLSEAIDRFTVAPDAIRAPTTLVASPDDELVPHPLMRELAEQLPGLRRLHSLPSLYGHDAFLKEPERLAPMIKTFLEEAVDA